MRYRIMAVNPLLKEAVVPQAVVVLKAAAVPRAAAVPKAAVAPQAVVAPKAAVAPQAVVAPQAAVRPPQKFLTAPSACPLPDPLTAQAVFIRHRFLPIP